MSQPFESTARLLDRARCGDQTALEQLFTRHLKPLQRWASGRLPRWARDVADTDDLVQDTLIQSFKRLDAFQARGVGALQAYLRQAVLNRIRDEIRRNVRRPRRDLIDSAVVDPQASPLDHAVGAEAVGRYERALGRLSEVDRDVVIARLELGHDYGAIAAIVGKPTGGAARVAVSRALRKLAVLMADRQSRGD